VAQQEAVAPAQELGPKGALNEERWSTIVDAAFDVFRQKGYQDATVQDVAERVGLLKGSLYYYIQSKEDLLYAIVQRAYLRAKQSLDDADGLTIGQPEDRLLRFIDVWTRNIEAQADAYRLAERETRYLSEAHRTEIRTLRRQIERVVAAIIEEGVTIGVFDSAVDTQLAVVTIFRLLNNHGTRPLRGPSAHRVRDWNKRFIMKGLLTDTHR
jgi:TetR/AcrR family transcriptional regulator, cholesterol catabolism regulator